MREIISFIVLSLFLACSDNSNMPDENLKTIEGQIFNSTLFVDGHENDGLLIKNCVFENIDGDGLQIRDVNNLIVEDCIFRNIEKDAIRFRNSGSSENVQILNNQIYEIQENGILLTENHINSKIIGNTIYNVALSNTSSQFGAPHHGLYVQGANFDISSNVIFNIVNDNGNCISVRTFGKISKNRLYNANKRGVSYFSNHPGFDGQLLIENNIIYDNGKRGIHLSSDGNLTNHIDDAIIRFNTVISNDQAPFGVDNNLIDVDLSFYGNIAIRLDGGSNFIFTNLPFENSSNLTSAVDVGFENFNGRNLHLKSTSIARGYATELIEFPIDDFDGELRDTNNLDAGADQFSN